MKFATCLTALAVPLSSPIFFATTGSAHSGDGGCSHGILYISDADSAAVYGYSVDEGMSQVVNLTTGIVGEPGQALHSTSSGLYLTSTFWGSENASNQDGVVNFIHTGTENHGDHFHYGEPYVLSDAQLDCGPVYHPSENAGAIALYCDGAAGVKVNTTYYIVNERMLGEGGNPYVFNDTLDGSHHGIAIPVDMEHVFHSLPTYEGANWMANASGLGDTFQIADSTGNVKFSLNDTSDPESSCINYHGSAVTNNSTFYLCCEGTILVVDYDEEAMEFSTRALDFPATISEIHRCGSVYTTDKSDFLVADYADWTADIYAPHLIGFPKDATELSDDDVLVLGETGMCWYVFDKSDGEHVTLFLGNGTVQIYTYARPDGWNLVADTTIEGMEGCDAILTGGYMQSYLAIPGTQKVYTFDLMDIRETGEIGVSSIELDFVPSDMAVGGVPPAYACAYSTEATDDAESGSSVLPHKAVLPVMLLAVAFAGVM